MTYIAGMKEFKRTKDWTVRITNFPKEKRNQLTTLAKSHRMSTGAYIGNLLEEEIRKASKEERA